MALIKFKILLRHNLIALCFLSFANPALCQRSGNSTKDSIDLSIIRKMEITLDTSNRFSGSTLFPFKSITIEDVRFDTTQVGIYSLLNNILKPTIKNYKITFTGGLRKSLAMYLNNYFKENLRNDDIELVCFLKKLNLVKRDTLTENVSLQRTYGQVNFQAEVFLRSGRDFYAAFKIDTILTESISLRKKEIADEMKDYLLMPALALLQNEISNTLWANTIKKKVFSQSVVYENYYNKRFDLPILKQLYKRGVYLTFSEFKNNAPSITDFKVQNGKSKTVSLIDKNGNYLATIKMFGYCDGERCWILKGNFGYPLIRTGNSFEFFFTIISNLKILLAIDMETGKVY